jgi:hypothetical protein
MPETEDFDVKSFQDRVLAEVRTLHTMTQLAKGFGEAPRRETVAPEEKGAGQLFGTLLLKVMTGVSDWGLRGFKESKRIDEITSQTRLFLKEQKTRQLLCPTLQNIENNLSRLALRTIEIDANEIAYAITPVLAPLAQAKAIEIPLDPLHFALSAWMIARTGVAKYCAGQDRVAEQAHDH